MLRTLSLATASSLSLASVARMASSSQASEKTVFKIYGYDSCPYYQRAVDAGERIADEHSDKFEVVVEGGERGAFFARLPTIAARVNDATAQAARAHTTCPIVLREDPSGTVHFVGGCDNFLTWIRKSKL
eukprot:Amastigsp_a6672_316.p2 type:complete len:130 gc:universal Amastigsp_a6672_316:59-448(+)